MEPQIRYVRSADGSRIAVSTIGQGPPLVYLPSGWLDSVEMYWQIPETRANLERLAERRRLVLFDVRGSGLSDRDVSDFSLAARLGDLAAVVDGLDEPAAALVGNVYSAPLAIIYAARNPDKVGALVLYNGLARGRDVIRTPRTRALRQLLEADWELYVQAWVLVYFGWTELGRRVASTIVRSLSADSFLARLRVLHEDDASVELPNVPCPTLLTLQRDGQIVSLETSRQMAAAIPNARLALVDQPNPLAFADEAGVRIIAEFLDEAGQRTTRKSKLPGGMSAILFTDLVGHTEMMSRLGDQRGREVLREHERITREVLKAHGGAEVKTTGDGFMASFGSATRAVECAIALQCAFADRNSSVRPEALEGLSVRVGLNAGEPIEEEGDLFGATVILASRIAAKAEGGEILVSDTVRGLCSGKGLLFSDRGEFVAKGFEDPVRVYEVKWRD